VRFRPGDVVRTRSRRVYRVSSTWNDGKHANLRPLNGAPARRRSTTATTALLHLVRTAELEEAWARMHQARAYHVEKRATWRIEGLMAGALVYIRKAAQRGDDRDAEIRWAYQAHSVNVDYFNRKAA
jgi:hypothetical protein